jgi:hypothetical protein
VRPAGRRVRCQQRHADENRDDLQHENGHDAHHDAAPNGRPNSYLAISNRDRHDAASYRDGYDATGDGHDATADGDGHDATPNGDGDDATADGDGNDAGSNRDDDCFRHGDSDSDRHQCCDEHVQWPRRSSRCGGRGCDQRGELGIRRPAGLGLGADRRSRGRTHHLGCNRHPRAPTTTGLNRRAAGRAGRSAGRAGRSAGRAG